MGNYPRTYNTTIASKGVASQHLADDIQVGSLADLDTTEKASVVGAINEVDGHADAAYALAEAAEASAAAKYTKPGGGIPSTDLTAAIQASLAKADAAIQPGATVTTLRIKKVQLNGWAKTLVGFQADDAAAISGVAAPVDMSGVGNGGTIKLTVDSESEATATLNCAAGYHAGGTGMPTTMVGQADNKFMISVDGADPVEVTCDWSGCNSAELIAAQIQVAIRTATSGLETCVVDTDHLKITGTTLGTDGSITITRAAANDCCDDLDIGPGNGTSTQGTGDCGDITAVTPAEIATLINGDISTVTATTPGGVLTVTSKTTGRGSRVLAGNGTLNALAGLPNGEVDYGLQGMGYDSDMADANYVVGATITGAAAAAGQGLATNAKAVGGFELTCETTSKTDYVDLVVLGLAA